MKAFILIPLLLSSCVIYDHEAVSKSGNMEHDKLWSLGGTSSQRGADGSSVVHDHQQSFRDGASAVGLAIGAYQAVKVNASNNALNTTKVKANTTPTVTTPTVDPTTGAVLTPTVTFPPPQ